MNGILDSGREARDASTLPLRLMVRSTDEMLRERYWEAVKALFTLKPTFELGRSIGSVSQSATAKLRSISEPDFRPGAGLLVGVFTVVILDGAFHGPSADVVRSLAASFSAVSLPGLAGNAQVEDWTIRVTGPATSADFTDDVSGTGVSWAGTLAAGQYLFLNGVAARRSTVATDWVSGGTDVSGGVSKPAAGILAFTPAVNPIDILTRTVSWSGSATGATSATEVTLRGRAAYV